MNCKIYKCISKTGVYLFIKSGDNPPKIPEELSEGLGLLEFVMDLKLSQNIKLARSDPGKVIDSIKMNGYYLQMPPANVYI